MRGRLQCETSGQCEVLSMKCKVWSVLCSGYCEIFTVQCKIPIFSLQRNIVIIKCITYKQGSTQSKIGWELSKSGCHMRSNNFHQKSHVYVDVKLFIPITLGFCTFLGLSDKFGSQPLSLVANFGCQPLISESISGGQLMAVKIPNWLGTRSHRSHLCGALRTRCITGYNIQ